MSFYYTLALVTSSAVLALAAPAAPSMTIETRNQWFGTFEPEPQGRGTWSLLFSCTATFGFCIWTVIHPNILFGATRWHRFGHKAVLMVESIIYPEFIIVTAFGEWLVALKLHKEWNRLVRDHPDYLGMDGAFFVVMGGFVFDTETTEDSKGSESAPERTESRATLTPAGFLKCLREGRINAKTFNKAAIVDKSKASNIVKLFSGSQALWLFAACSARWGASLPLSLLEIHILIQVACTFFVFAFWWSKPLDVNEPLTITLGPEPTIMLGPEPTPTDGGAPPTDRAQSPRSPRNRLYITERPSSSIAAVLCKAAYDVVVALTPSPLGSGFGNTSTSPNAWKDILNSNALRLLMETFFVFAAGILHAAAWYFKFPTDIERTMWRVCSVGLCVLIPSALSIGLICDFDEELVDFWGACHLKQTDFGQIVSGLHNMASGVATKKSKGSRNTLRYCVYYVSVWVVLSHFVCYIACVLFITVESYISLRAPPKGTFSTPRWNNYWPHL